MQAGAGLQGIINSFEVGGVRAFLRGFFFTVFVLALIGFRIHTGFRGLTDPDAMEQAQLARSVARGEGFTTRCLRPADVGFLASHGRESASSVSWPDTRNAPGYPAALALVMKVVRPTFEVEPDAPVFAAERSTVLPLCILCTLGTGLFLFLLAKRLFGPYVALMSALVFFLTETVLDVALSGTAMPLAMLLVTASAYAAVRCLDARYREQPLYAWAVPLALSALLFGAAVLTRYALMAAIPLLVFLVGAAFEKRRLSTILAFLVLAGAVVAPWCIRNARVSGLPFGNAPHTVLSDTVLYEGDAFDRGTAPALRNTLIVRALRMKAVTNVTGIWERELFAMGGGLIIALFLVSFFHRFRNPAGNTLRWAVGAGGIALMLACALTEDGSAGLLGVLYPLVVVLGAAFFFDTLDRIEFLDPAWHPALMWLVVALTALSAIAGTLGGRPERPYPPYYPPYAAFAAKQVDGEEILATDIPWATAWYGDCPSILIPRSVGGFQALDASRLKLGALYLTTETSDRAYASELVGGPYRSWLPVLNGREPRNPEFRFKHAVMLPEGTREQVLLVPDTRWGKGVSAPTAENEGETVAPDQSTASGEQ